MTRRHFDIFSKHLTSFGLNVKMLYRLFCYFYCDVNESKFIRQNEAKRLVHGRVVDVAIKIKTPFYLHSV